jgi:indole-3-glycerol phosphate synthase
MNVLSSIIEGVLADLETRKLTKSQLDEALSAAPNVRDPLESLRRYPLSVIAEVKRSSPSKGALAEIPEPATLARRYESAGASVVSVLTEQRRFGGSLKDLHQVRGEIQLPVLRKDFIVNEYLVKESRAYGADLLLLIVAALDDYQLRDLYSLSTELGMRVLVEVHDLSEMERAIAISPDIIDLKNFDSLLPNIPPTIYRVAESGISERDQVKAAYQLGANAVLVGESLVKADSPESLIADFLNVATGK